MGAFLALHPNIALSERALIRSVFEHDDSLSETELRATQPRRNPRVFVAVRRFAAVGSPVARLLLFAS